MLCRGYAGVTKIKNTHLHIHGESKEDGVSKTTHPLWKHHPLTPPPRGRLAELKSRPGRVSCERQCVLHKETANRVHTMVESARCLYATLSTRHIYKKYRAARGRCDDNAGAIRGRLWRTSNKKISFVAHSCKTKPLPRQRLCQAV